MRNKLIVLITFICLAAILALSFGCTKKKAGDVKIGAILPMTGSASNYGDLMRRGIDMAVEEVNTDGGVNGAKAVVIIEDSASTPAQGVNALGKLIKVDHVTAIMPALSSIVLACAPITEQNHVVLLNAPANSPKLRGAGSYLYNIMILSDQESEYLAEYAMKKMGAKTFGILYVNNDSGVGYKNSFTNQVENNGGKVLLAEGHEQGDTDFRTVIEKFKSASPDVVFLASYYAETALFMKQAKERGYVTKWLSYSQVEAPKFLELAGNAANGIIYSQPGFDAESSDQIVKDFVSKYKERYKEMPDLWGVQFYVATKLLFQAIRETNNTSDGIKKYLDSIKGDKSIIGPISFNSDRTINRPVKFKKIVDGSFVNIDGR